MKDTNGRFSICKTNKTLPFPTSPDFISDKVVQRMEDRAMINEDKTVRKFISYCRTALKYGKAVVDSKKHFVVDAVPTSDINDQKQLSHTALDAKKLLNKK